MPGVVKYKRWLGGGSFSEPAQIIAKNIEQSMNENGIVFENIKN
jgi:hypothetical protein